MRDFGLCVFTLLLLAAPLSSPAAEVTLLNAARIHTLDTAHPRAQAMAFDADGKILALGDSPFAQAFRALHHRCR